MNSPINNNNLFYLKCNRLPDYLNVSVSDYYVYFRRHPRGVYNSKSINTCFFLNKEIFDMVLEMPPINVNY